MIFDASKFTSTWSRATGELMSHPALYFPPLAIAAASGVGFDFVATDAPTYLPLANIFYGVLALVVQAWAIGIALKSSGHALESLNQWRIGSLFLLGLLSGLGLLLGALLLLLPLFYLAGHWFVAAPAMLVERLSVSDALRRSWHLLERHWLAAALLFLVCGIGRFAPLAVETILPQVSGALLWAIRVTANTVSEASGLLSIVAGVFLYLDLCNPASTAEEIFG